MSLGGYNYLTTYPDQATVVAFVTNTTLDDRPLSGEALAEQIAKIFHIQ